MTDLSQTVAPKSDQLNADDLISGPRDITVTRVSANESNADQPVNVYFEGDGGKPFRPCKSMRRVMIAAWGSDGNQYAGKSMRLYRDPEVKFGGMKVGGIRISHMSHIEQDVQMALTESRTKRSNYRVKVMQSAPTQSQDAPATQIDADAILSEAQDAAEKGTAAFKDWYKNKSPAEREIAQGSMRHFQSTAEAADSVPSDDPFAPSGEAA